MNSEMKNIRVNYMKEPVTDTCVITQYYLKFTTCQTVRLYALLYSDFFFRNSVQFLRAFKNMYLCYNLVACVAGVNGEGVGRARSHQSLSTYSHS